MKLSECPVRATADVIDGKWKPMIVNALKAKPLRFGQLLRALPEASRKVASEQLRELESEGIISRTAFGNRWERVEYSLTGYGRTLVPVLTLIVPVLLMFAGLRIIPKVEALALTVPLFVNVEMK